MFYFSEVLVNLGCLAASSYQPGPQPQGVHHFKHHVLEKWTELIDQGSNIGVAYMDFMKAFDKVSHSRLMKKLKVMEYQARHSHCILTCGCSTASNWKPGPHVVSAIRFTLEASNRTRGNTSYILGHCIEKAYCPPSKTIIGK